MAGITQAMAQVHLDAWLAADLAVAGGQSYTIGTRTLTRAQAVEIRGNIKYWQQQVVAATRTGGLRVRYAFV